MTPSDLPTAAAPDSSARERIAVAAGAALLGAGLIFVMFVLPAEYGVDPLGTGARTGLLDLGVTGQAVEALESAKAAGAGAAQVLVKQERTFNTETVDFPIAPHEGVEYKYRLEQGESLVYTWKTSVPVNYEAHAEPDSGPRGYAQSYEKAQGASDTGTLTAPFTGIHGWYWENTTDQPITLSLSTAGFYNLSHEFRSGQPVKNKEFR